ncbi:sensor histidine kinase [Spirosoma sp. BT702]|uniref:Sensor histidine kinase n=1 Tax=Spirosoma profusum TaxID=2771354 RepID=A0A926XWC0_9BACT|nr:sensor histidine kinase [Spirosoma profusum]MBD2701812.1 sensor histidine kinase [Spirosoma profusum]
MQQDTQKIVIIVLLGTLLFMVQGGFIIFYLLFFKRKQRTNQQEQIAIRATYEREILQSQMEVRNQTSQYIGEELHDNIGQLLTIVRLNLGILEESDLRDDYKQTVKDTNETLGTAINDLRAISKSLDSDSIKDFGLQNGLANEVLRIQKTGKYQIELKNNGHSFSLGFQIEIVLFRICQEILNNALKHSGASHITIQLSYEPDLFQLSIVDNGKGFDYAGIMSDVDEKRGSGLRNINRRVNLLDGQVVFRSNAGAGTSIIITLPISSDSSKHGYGTN